MFIWILILAQVIALSGCSNRLESSGVEEKHILAKINNYRMSVSDFKRGVEFVLGSKYFSVEPNEAKDELLDELITRNVLLQEAQRQDLDKEQAFMREIEKYWEEALLKLLIKRKSGQIAGVIKVEDSELIRDYSLMKTRIFAHLLILNEQGAAQRFAQASDDEFTRLTGELKAKIISEEPAQWYMLGDLPDYLEEALFALDAGQRTPPIKSGSNWVVITAIEKEQMDIEPYEKMAPVMRTRIYQQKKERLLQDWIDDLKNNTAIQIDQNLLNQINLE